MRDYLPKGATDTGQYHLPFIPLLADLRSQRPWNHGERFTDFLNGGASIGFRRNVLSQFAVPESLVFCLAHGLDIKEIRHLNPLCPCCSNNPYRIASMGNDCLPFQHDPLAGKGLQDFSMGSAPL